MKKTVFSSTSRSRCLLANLLVGQYLDHHAGAKCKLIVHDKRPFCNQIAVICWAGVDLARKVLGIFLERRLFGLKRGQRASSGPLHIGSGNR